MGFGYKFLFVAFINIGVLKSVCVCLHACIDAVY